MIMQYYSENLHAERFHDVQKPQYQQQTNFEPQQNKNSYYQDYDHTQNIRYSYSQKEDYYDSQTNNQYTERPYQPPEQHMTQNFELNQSYVQDSKRVQPHHLQHDHNPRSQMLQYSENYHPYNSQDLGYHQQGQIEHVQLRLDQVQIHNDSDELRYNDPINCHFNRPTNLKNEASTAQLWHTGSYHDQSYNQTDAERDVPSGQHQQKQLKTYGEPIRLHEIGKPQVLAKTSGGGDAVAVFGVVAQVEKSPTSQQPPAIHSLSPGNQQRTETVQSPPFGSSNRTHHLTPIMEQPFPDSNFKFTNQQPNHPRGKFDNRNSAQLSKPDNSEFTPRSRFSGEFERHREPYRDEYTDSGYGSTLTERSYEGPMKNHLSFKPDIREPYRDSRPPDHSTIPQQQWQKPTFTQSTNQPNYRPRSYIEQSQDLQNDLQQRNRNNQWPVDTRQANQSNEQYQHHSSGIDVSRTRGVQSMKKMFDKPGAVPLPPVSTSYGANQYSSGDSRQIPPRPRVSSDENRYQQEQSVPSNETHYEQEQRTFSDRFNQSHSPPYRSYDNVAQQQPHQHHSSQLPLNSYEQENMSSRNPPMQKFPPQQRYLEPRSPPGQTNRQFGGHVEKQSLPHFEPPPQHSQSMSNLDDFHPQENWPRPSQKPRTRSSYTNEQDNDMVVGVRFEKRNTAHGHRGEHLSTACFSPTSFGRNQMADKRHEYDDQSRLAEDLQPRPSSPVRHTQEPLQTDQYYHEENFIRDQTSANYSQSLSNFPTEGVQVPHDQPRRDYSSVGKPPAQVYEQPHHNQNTENYNHPAQTRAVTTEERNRYSASHPRSNNPPADIRPPPMHPKPNYIPSERRPPPPSNPKPSYRAEERMPPQSYSATSYGHENRSPPHSQSMGGFSKAEFGPAPPLSQSNSNYAFDESRPVQSQVSKQHMPQALHSRPKRNYFPEEEIHLPPHSHLKDNQHPEDLRPSHSQFKDSYVSEEPRSQPSSTHPSNKPVTTQNRPHPAQSQPRDNHDPKDHNPPTSHSQFRDSYAPEEPKSSPFNFQPDNEYISRESQVPPTQMQPRDTYVTQGKRLRPNSQPSPAQSRSTANSRRGNGQFSSDNSGVSGRGQTKPPSPEFLLQKHQASTREEIYDQSQSDRYKQSRDHRSQSDRYEQSRHQERYRREPEQNYESERENYVPDVVTKSYGLYSQSQVSEEWPDPPNIEEQTNSYQNSSENRGRTDNQREPSEKSSYLSGQNENQNESRRSPPGGDNKRNSYRQIPRHPFDPDDDSSEEVDVDAPTPPPSNKQKQRINQFIPNEQKSSQPTSSQFQLQPRPTGERHYQSARQPGDGLNEDQYSLAQVSHQQTNNASRPVAPKKPSRNSLKQSSATSQEEQIPAVFQGDSSPALNHKHSKDRARLAQAGKVAKKPPNRSRSSTMLTEDAGDNSDYEITVTSNDLTRTHTSQEIIVHKTSSECKLKEDKLQSSPHTQQAITEAIQADLPIKTQESSKPEEPKRTKLIFKPPPENALKPDKVALPDIKEPRNGDKKMPPTYTDLLGQFKSHRVTAMRNAAEKHERALKTAKAAISGPNQTKRDENRDIYNQSKPKYNRDDYNRSDRGRVDKKSPERHGRSHDRHGSPERRDRSKDFDREHRSRKSEREKEQRSAHRVVSPHKGRGKDENPYHRSPHRRRDDPPHSRNRNGEPDWVEQYRRRRAGNESPKRRNHVDESRRKQKKEFDFDQYQRDVKKATSYNSDYDQPPVRQQLLPTKLMAKGHSKPTKRPPQGSSDWMKNLKEKNQRANRNRK